MSSLNAALPLREVDRLSPSVRDELQLDMPGRLDQPFNIESTLSESSHQHPSRIRDRKSTRLNSSHGYISYAVFCLKKKKRKILQAHIENQPHRRNTTPQPSTNVALDRAQPSYAAHQRPSRRMTRLTPNNRLQSLFR